ncbi:MAG: hypothetical protein ACLQVY_28345, partial [Limisphaerales bacterium]
QNQIIPAETQEISKPLVILFFENKQQNEDAQRLVKALIDQPRGGLLFVLGINEFSGHEQKTVSENVEFLQFTSKSDKPNGQNMVDTIKSAKEQNRPVIIVSGGDKGGGFTELTNGMKPDTLGRLKMYKNLKLPTGSIHSVILFDPKIGVTGTTGSEMTINFDVISNRVYNFYSRYGQVGKESKATTSPFRSCSRNLEKKNPNLLFFVVFVSFVVEFGLRPAALCLCVEFHQCSCMAPQFMRHTSNLFKILP